MPVQLFAHGEEHDPIQVALPLTDDPNAQCLKPPMSHSPRPSTASTDDPDARCLKSLRCPALNPQLP